jgi:hypothetical protein
MPKFLVLVNEEVYHRVEVEAIDKNTAVEMAYEILNTDNGFNTYANGYTGHEVEELS